MADILDLVKTQKAQDFAAGETLIHEGLTLGKLFVLAEGQVEVIRRDMQVTHVDEPGSVFGEMSVLLDQPYSATVKALSDVKAYVIDDAFGFLKAAPGGGAGAGDAPGAAALLHHRLSRRPAAAGGGTAAGPRRGRPDSRLAVPEPGRSGEGGGRRRGHKRARPSLRRTQSTDVIPAKAGILASTPAGADRRPLPSQG